MAGIEDYPELQVFEDMLQSRAKELLSYLDKGDFTSAMGILAELSEARNTMLYQEVGRLTRGLHEAIKEFNIDVENSTAFQATSRGDELSKVANANERLNYVLELTETAANTTMDKVDSTMPIAEELGEQARLLRQDWKAMADAKATLSEVKDLGRTTEAFLMTIENGTSDINKNLTEILLAQGFQDLTGQMITRVISLVNEVESSLVNLVAVAGQVEKIRGADQPDEEQDAQNAEADEAVKEEEQLVKGHGPQINAGKKDGIVAGQDEVDDLLSSLGF